MNDKETIGAKIKTLRQRKRWTQEKLVEVARQFVPSDKVLNRPNISMYESGRNRPDLWAIIAIARALGVSVEYLTGEERAPAMLTPEPELWDAVAEANKYPPATRRVLAEILQRAMSLVSSETPATSAGATYRQALDAWAEQSPREVVEQSLQAALAQRTFDELGSDAAIGQPDADPVPDEEAPKGQDK